MTQTLADPQSSPPVSERLRDARERAGLTLDQAAGATGLLRSYVAALEAGRRRPLPREVDRLAGAYGTDLSDLLPARRPVEVDAGRISVAGQSRALRDAADDREVYAAYLFLLYAVRGAAPGEHLPLRSGDVDLLMSLVGHDAATTERRLVALMGCTPEEASLLHRVLVRHRALTASVGVAVALSAAAVGGVVPGTASDGGRAVTAEQSAEPASPSGSPSQISGGSSSAAYYPVDGEGEDGVGAYDGVDSSTVELSGSESEDGVAAR